MFACVEQLLFYVKEIYFPTAQAIAIRRLDFQVDEETYKVDQGMWDDVGA